MSDKPFLVISSFNNSGSHLLEYGSGFQLFDQSTDPYWMTRNEELGAIKAPHVGHDLNNILNYIFDNYENLPEKIAFVKANTIGRHCTKEYFENNINNDFYTNFYYDPKVVLGTNVNDVPFPGLYLEINNSWYVKPENHDLFCTFDQLANRLFDDYRPGTYTLFAPGACFLIPRAHILRHPKELYSILATIATYKFFPDEAFIVERILPTVFLSGYQLSSDFPAIEKEIEKRLLQDSHRCSNLSLGYRVRKKLSYIFKSGAKIEAQSK